jgi:DNA-directed RNA polymerase specialized sigma54-like protein
MAISISPQVRQSQMPASDLQILTGSSLQVDQSIKALLQTNTMIEDDSMDDRLASSLDSLQESPENYLEDDIYGHKSQSDGGNMPDFSEMPPADKTSLEEDLLRELSNSNLQQDSPLYSLVEGMISDLDVNGFLINSDSAQIKAFDSQKYADLFFFKTGIDVKYSEVDEAKSVLKQLGDRVGVSGLGCSDTHECLLHQISAGKGPVYFTANVILKDHYKDILKGTDFLDTLKVNYPTALEYFPEAMALIERLNPSPGNRDSSKMTQTHLRGATFNVSFFDDIYETATEQHRTLKLSADKLTILQQYESDNKAGKLSENKSKVYSYLKSDYQAAIKTIRLLDARRRMQDVILKTIVTKQKVFLRTNDYSKLIPISINELSESVIEKMRKLLDREDFSVSSSTVRNYLRGNTLQSDHGFYSLRDLVPSQGRVNILQSRALVGEIFEKENPMGPLTDKAVSELVRSNTGTRITTNMVTKIRKELNVASPLIRKARALINNNELRSASDHAMSAVHNLMTRIISEEPPMSPFRDATIAILINKELKNNSTDFREVKKMREELNIGDQATRALIHRKSLQADMGRQAESQYISLGSPSIPATKSEVGGLSQGR